MLECCVWAMNFLEVHGGTRFVALFCKIATSEQPFFAKSRYNLPVLSQCWSFCLSLSYPLCPSLSLTDSCYIPLHIWLSLFFFFFNLFFLHPVPLSLIFSSSVSALQPVAMGGDCSLLAGRMLHQTWLLRRRKRGTKPCNGPLGSCVH